MFVEFIEAPLFTRLLPRYMDDEDYHLLQVALAGNPELGDVMPDSGGLRKLRWRDPRRAKGKRGGLRVIYYCFAQDTQIWMLTLYAKGEVTDLTAAERGMLRVAIEQEKRARRGRPATRRR